MWPPTAMPNVTAGFTCPPEAFAAMYTAEESAKAFAIATITRLDGSAAASGNNFPDTHPNQTSALKLVNRYLQEKY
jgi:hypothetical protein